MAGLSLSGLASGFDWKSLVDQLMQVEAAPINRMQREQDKNSAQSDALKTLGTKIDSLSAAAKALQDVTIFSSRSAKSATSASTWSTSVAAGTATGSHTIAVSQLATGARLTGTSDIADSLNASDDVAGLTLANLGTGAAPTAGTFSINGKKVTVALTDSLASVFSAISDATDGDVTASYDHTTDKITLTSASNSTITLGAANDTSNLLRVLKLGNNGGSTVTSSGALGALKLNAKLNVANLRTPVANADGSGDSSFTINGVSISYNVNTDTVSGIIKRINAAGAGVTANYDSINDRVTLANNSTGDLGIATSETGTGILAALGLTGGTFTRGKNAEFTIDDGPTLTSASNTLDASSHGVAGLSVTVDSQTTQTITVSADTDVMRTRINAFITAFNGVQSYIDDKTKVTSANGKVTTSVLSGNRDIQATADQLRSAAFAAVSGVSGTIQRLEHLGIDFDGTSGQLKVDDDTKLTAALEQKPQDVERFFQTTTTGFVDKITKLLKNFSKTNTDAQDRLSKANDSLDQQIADTQRRLDQERELLTNSFIAMESAQQKIQSQGTALTNSFGGSSNNK
jgi:flagellar hook-associated protein 2